MGNLAIDFATYLKSAMLDARVVEATKISITIIVINRLFKIRDQVLAGNIEKFSRVISRCTMKSLHLYLATPTF